jgi:cob(I)alamin adenosyltransferase
MKTFNKRGDRGETSLLFGERVPKFDPRCEAYGTVDEAVSCLGLARALSGKEKVRDIILRLQKEMFTVGSELATSVEYYPRLRGELRVVTPKMVQELEDTINELQRDMEMPRSFVIPGTSMASAAMDVARTIIRRTERRVVKLKHDDMIDNEELPKYLNRLADLVFTLARYEEADIDGDNTRH